jgi:hypothetical protein
MEEIRLLVELDIIQYMLDIIRVVCGTYVLHTHTCTTRYYEGTCSMHTLEDIDISDFLYFEKKTKNLFIF